MTRSRSSSYRSDEHSNFFRPAIAILLAMGLCSSTCRGDTLDRDVKLAFLGIGLAGAAVVTGISLAVHHSHTSLTGCVVQSTDVPRVTTSSGKTYELVNAPAELKPDEKLSFRGHKIKTASGLPAFRVDRISGDHGPCKGT